MRLEGLMTEVEAKKASRSARRSAMRRLTTGGACDTSQIKRRARWLEAEWKLPPFPRIGQTMTHDLVVYCKKHGVNLDWLIAGDLKELRLMTVERRQKEGNGEGASKPKRSVPAKPKRGLSKAEMAVAVVQDVRDSILKRMARGNTIHGAFTELLIDLRLLETEAGRPNA